MVAYILYLRGRDLENPLHAATTVQAYLTSISSVCHYFGLASPCAAREVQSIMADILEKDGFEGTAAFNFSEELPGLFSAVWFVSHWTYAKRVKCWAMFLVAVCIFARASDVTTFCPVYEDIEMPPAFVWDSESSPDGIPPYIIIILRYASLCACLVPEVGSNYPICLLSHLVFLV